MRLVPPPEVRRVPVVRSRTRTIAAGGGPTASMAGAVGAAAGDGAPPRKLSRGADRKETRG